MTTALDIITDALGILNVYAAGEAISDADAEQCLTRLNDMMDSWSNESLACYAILEQSVALVAGKSTYTIGTSGGADINATRPLRLIEGPGAAYIQDGNGNNFDVDVVTQDQWNLIGNRGSTVNANIPTVLFYDPQFPLGKLNFWAQPNIGGYTAFWDQYQQLTDFTNLAATFSLPPGYALALKTNLAVHIKPYFATAQLDPDVRDQAAESKRIIKRTNMRTSVALYDPEIVSRSQGSYNWQNDSYNGRN